MSVARDSFFRFASILDSDHKNALSGELDVLTFCMKDLTSDLMQVDSSGLILSMNTNMLVDVTVTC